MVDAMLTPNEVIDKIKPKCLVKELVVKVRSIEQPRTGFRNSDNSEFTVFSFVVDNQWDRQEGKFFTCQAYDNAVEMFFSKVAVNDVIRIKNAIAKPITTTFTPANTGFVLSLGTATVISKAVDIASLLNSAPNAYQPAAPFGALRKRARNDMGLQIAPNPGPSQPTVEEPDDVDELLGELGAVMRGLDADKRKILMYLCRRDMHEVIKS